MQPRAAVAALSALLAVAGAQDARAAGTVRTLPEGTIERVALSGDGEVVARRPSNGRGLLVIERRAPGAAPVTLLRTRIADDVALAASREAVAVSLQRERDEDFSPSRVLVGPATGPLREVASCTSSLFRAPVAVEGPRIAWGEGGCGTPAESPREAGPSAVAVGAADPAAPVRRSPIEGERVAIGLAFSGDRGFVGLVRASLFSFYAGELRAFGPEGVGSARSAGAAGDFAVPVGILPGGTGVLVRQRLDDSSDSSECGSVTVTVAGDGTDPRPLPLGGACLSDDEDDFGESPLTTSGDRAVALVEQRLPRSDPRRGEATAIVSARAGGAGRRVVSRARYRTPLGITASPTQVAWWQPRCPGGTELVRADPAPSGPGSRSVRSCRVELLSQRARLRGRYITLRLRCPLGCRGQAIDDSTCNRRWITQYRFGRGIHRLRLAIPRSSRRRGRLLLRLNVDYGPSRSRVVRLRR